MNNTLFSFPKPENEPVLGYAPGSPERKKIREALEELYKKQFEICPIIGGKKVKTKETGTIVMPTDNKHVLAKYYKVGEKEVKMAIDAAMEAHEEWANTPWMERASVITGNAAVNRLGENVRWGMYSNYLSVPTDCPQRNERLGWTGDAQVFSPTACFQMDTRAFYRKFLKDLLAKPEET